MTYIRFEPIYFPQTPHQGHDDLCGRFAGTARLSRHAPFGESKAVLVRRGGRPYEGDTLVVHTIGLNDKTFVDGNILEVSIRAEDPDTYYEPWSAIQRFRRVQQQMREEVCAENNQHLFDYGTPVANKPDL
jgi:hypothetical protein